MAKNRSLQRRVAKPAPQTVAVWGAAIAGLAGVLLPPEKVAVPDKSAMEALRGDWRKIGGDIDAVIARENARIKETA